MYNTQFFTQTTATNNLCNEPTTNGFQTISMLMESLDVVQEKIKNQKEGYKIYDLNTTSEINSIFNDEPENNSGLVINGYNQKFWDDINIGWGYTMYDGLNLQNVPISITEYVPYIKKHINTPAYMVPLFGTCKNRNDLCELLEITFKNRPDYREKYLKLICAEDRYEVCYRTVLIQILHSMAIHIDPSIILYAKKYKSETSDAFELVKITRKNIALIDVPMILSFLLSNKTTSLGESITRRSNIYIHIVNSERNLGVFTMTDISTIPMMSLESQKCAKLVHPGIPIMTKYEEAILAGERVNERNVRFIHNPFKIKNINVSQPPKQKPISNGLVPLHYI